MLGGHRGGVDQAVGLATPDRAAMRQPCGGGEGAVGFPGPGLSPLSGEAGDLSVEPFPHLQQLHESVGEGGCVPVAAVLCGQGGDPGGDVGDRV